MCRDNTNVCTVKFNKQIWIQLWIRILMYIRQVTRYRLDNGPFLCPLVAPWMVWNTILQDLWSKRQKAAQILPWYSSVPYHLLFSPPPPPYLLKKGYSHVTCNASKSTVFILALQFRQSFFHFCHFILGCHETLRTANKVWPSVEAKSAYTW